LINPSIFLSSPAIIHHGQNTEVRGRLGRGKEQRNYKSDQVGQSGQQGEYKMSAGKAEAEGTGRAEKPAARCRGFQQKKIIKTTNQFKALL